MSGEAVEEIISKLEDKLEDNQKEQQLAIEKADLITDASLKEVAEERIRFLKDSAKKLKSAISKEKSAVSKNEVGGGGGSFSFPIPDLTDTETSRGGTRTDISNSDNLTSSGKAGESPKIPELTKKGEPISTDNQEFSDRESKGKETKVKATGDADSRFTLGLKGHKRALRFLADLADAGIKDSNKSVMSENEIEFINSLFNEESETFEISDARELSEINRIFGNYQGGLFKRSIDMITGDLLRQYEADLIESGEITSDDAKFLTRVMAPVNLFGNTIIRYSKVGMLLLGIYIGGATILMDKPNTSKEDQAKYQSDITNARKKQQILKSYAESAFKGKAIINKAVMTMSQANLGTDTAKSITDTQNTLNAQNTTPIFKKALKAYVDSIGKGGGPLAKTLLGISVPVKNKEGTKNLIASALIESSTNAKQAKVISNTLANLSGIDGVYKAYEKLINGYKKGLDALNSAGGVNLRTASKKAPKGSHFMKDGSVMKDSDMPKKAKVETAQYKALDKKVKALEKLNKELSKIGRPKRIKSNQAKISVLIATKKKLENSGQRYKV